MELDRKERLFLYNQYKILDKLYPAEGYDRYAEIVSDGYEGEYGHLVTHIYDRGLSAEECKFVRDVMSMHMRLRWAYDDLSAEDKAEIPEHTITFRGFDGNNETMLMAYARFLIEDGHSYQNIKDGGDGLNSHMPTVARYRNMLDIWRSQRMETKERLTKDDVLTLANATY